MIESTKKHLGWAGASLVVVGYYLNANQISSCWLLWIVGNLLVGVYSMQKEAYPTAFLSFVLVVMSIYGYIKWI